MQGCKITVTSIPELFATDGASVAHQALQVVRALHAGNGPSLPLPTALYRQRQPRALRLLHDADCRLHGAFPVRVWSLRHPLVQACRVAVRRAASADV